MSKKISSTPNRTGDKRKRTQGNPVLTPPVFTPKEDLLAPSGVLVCKQCSAVYHDKHWYIPEEKDEIAALGLRVHKVLCPGCYRVQQQISEGEVVLESPELRKDGIRGLIANVEHKCWNDNPTSKICSLKDYGDRIEIKTTTEWLAVRIGKEMRKSHKGHLDIKWAANGHAVVVSWSKPEVD